MTRVQFSAAEEVYPKSKFRVLFICRHVNQVNRLALEHKVSRFGKVPRFGTVSRTALNSLKPRMTLYCNIMASMHECDAGDLGSAPNAQKDPVWN